MTNPATDDDIRQIAADYEAEIEAAREHRDERIRAALNSGRKQVEIVKLTGYSRETIRQAADPAIREAARQAQAARYRAQKGAS